MVIESTISRWIDGLREGDERSAQELWEAYFQRLVEYAGRKLPRGVLREFDEEDVALSAFHSLCRGVHEGRFPDLQDRSNIWALLVVITARKISNRAQKKYAQKRGGDRVKGESVFDDASSDERHGLSRIIGNEPSPEFALEVAEESERLLDFLEDPTLKELALLRLQGLTQDAISDRLGIAKRTVERRMGLIRKLWLERAEKDG